MRARLDDVFAALGAWAFRRRGLALAISLAVTAATGSQLGRLRLDSSIEGFFHADDPALLAYEDFRRRFGKDDLFVLALRPDEVFSPAFLARLVSLHRQLEEAVPHVRSVTSLANVRRTRGEGEELVVEALLATLPADDREAAQLRERVLADPLYVRSLVSEDGRVTALVLRPRARVSDPATGGDRDVSKAEYTQMVDRIRELARPLRDEGVEVFLAGHPVVAAALDAALLQDMARTAPLALGVAALFLALAFRRLSGVVHPCLVVVASLVSTFGAMGALGVPLTSVGSILPAFLIVVGVADSVHVLGAFYRHLAATGDPATAVERALRHSGLAVLLTSVTTAAGLASFATAEVAPVADLGLVAPLGVLFALLHTLLLLPALLALFPPRATRPEAGAAPWGLDWLLTGLGRLAVRRARTVVAAASALVLLACGGLAGLRFSHDPLGWFPEGHELRVSAEAVDRALKGSLALEAVLDTGRDNGLYDAALMRTLAGTVEELERYRRGTVAVGNASTVTTVLAEVNRALHDNSPAAYRVPDTDGMVAEQLLLFEMSGSDDLEDWVTRDNRRVRVTLRVPRADAILYAAVVDDLERTLRSRLPGVGVAVTGSVALFARTIDNAVTSMARSYVLAGLAVTVLMLLLLGGLRVGLLSLVPNLAPIVVVVGAMGWLDLPFDLSNMLIGSVAIGLVVDDTIHFLHHFRRYHAETGDVGLAVERTLRTSGRAIVVTSLTLASGFFVFTTATLSSSTSFGLLAGTTVLLAMAADCLLVPALLALLYTGRRAAHLHPADPGHPAGGAGPVGG